MPKFTLTANAADQFGLSLGPDDSGFSAHVVAGGSLGGGTLTLKIKESTNDADAAETLDTLAVGDNFEFRVGGGCQISYTLSGATSPNAVLRLRSIR